MTGQFIIARNQYIRAAKAAADAEAAVLADIGLAPPDDAAEFVLDAYDAAEDVAHATYGLYAAQRARAEKLTAMIEAFEAALIATGDDRIAVAKVVFDAALGRGRSFKFAIRDSVRDMALSFGN